MKMYRYLTKEENSKLGETGRCDICGNDGMYIVDPYMEEIYNEEKLVCYCSMCEYESTQDI